MAREDIVLFIESQSFNHNNILLLDYDSMKKAIEMCNENKVEVLGIDAFFLKENKIQPVLDKSVDFSSEFNLWKAPNEYVEYLGEDGKRLLFEVIV